MAYGRLTQLTLSSRHARESAIFPAPAWSRWTFRCRTSTSPFRPVLLAHYQGNSLAMAPGGPCEELIVSN
jgi:hypothetical protein